MSRSLSIPRVLASAGVALAACQNTPPATAYRPSNVDDTTTVNDAVLDTDAGLPPTAAEREALRTPMLSCDGVATSLPDGRCQRQAQGVYAVDIELDVWWQDTADPDLVMFDPGRGKLHITSKLALGEFCPDGRAAAALETCGLQLPAVYIDPEGGVLQLAAADSVWDRADMPVAAATATARGFGPDAPVALADLSQSIGIDLAPVASWPSYEQTPFVDCGEGRTGEDCFVDQDGDGHPGITLTVQASDAPETALYAHPSGWRYTPMPTGPAPFIVGSGAARLYAALRTEAMLPQLMGALGDECHGDSTDQPASASDVLLRVFDCSMRDGSACSVAAATFVDQHIPAFHVLAEGQTPPATWKHPRKDADEHLDRSPSRGARSTTRWLGDLDQNPSCADVRASASAEG